MKDMKWLFCLSFAVTTIMVAGCAPSAAPPTLAPAPPPKEGEAKPAPKAAARLEKVKLMSAVRGGGSSTFYVGRDKGLYKEQGIDLEIVVMKAALGIPALISGEVDYAAHNSGVVEAASKGVDAKVLLGTASKSVWHLMVGPGINTVQDLKGKSVGIRSFGTIGHYSGRVALKHLGLDPDKDVNWVAVPDDMAAVAALKAGTIGGSPLSAPFNKVAEEQGSKELVFIGDVPSAPPSGAGLGAMTKKIKDNPDQIRKMIRGTIKSLSYFRDNPKEVKEYLMKEFELDRKTLDPFYDDMIKGTSFSGSIPDSTFQAWVDMARTTGSIKGDFDWRKAVDFSFLKEVQQELKIAP